MLSLRLHLQQCWDTCRVSWTCATHAQKCCLHPITQWQMVWHCWGTEKIYMLLPYSDCACTTEFGVMCWKLLVLTLSFMILPPQNFLKQSYNSGGQFPMSPYPLMHIWKTCTLILIKGWTIDVSIQSIMIIMIHEFHGIIKMQPLSTGARCRLCKTSKFICQNGTWSRIIKESCTKFHSHVEPIGNP